MECSNRFSEAAVGALGLKKILSVTYDDWVYVGKDGPEKPFKGMNEAFTKKVNAKYGYEKFTNVAEAYAVMDGAIDDVLEQSEAFLF